MALLLWRLWKFTFVPALYPDDPIDLPYWTPCMLNSTPINSAAQLLIVFSYSYRYISLT